jgi:hypothetical protein
MKFDAKKALDKLEVNVDLPFYHNYNFTKIAEFLYNLKTTKNFNALTNAINDDRASTYSTYHKNLKNVLKGQPQEKLAGILIQFYDDKKRDEKKNEAKYYKKFNMIQTVLHHFDYLQSNAQSDHLIIAFDHFMSAKPSDFRAKKDEIDKKIGEQNSKLELYESQNPFVKLWNYLKTEVQRAYCKDKNKADTNSIDLLMVGNELANLELKNSMVEKYITFFKSKEAAKIQPKIDIKNIDTTKTNTELLKTTQTPDKKPKAPEVKTVQCNFM